MQQQQQVQQQSRQQQQQQQQQQTPLGLQQQRGFPRQALSNNVMHLQKPASTCAFPQVIFISGLLAGYAISAYHFDSGARVLHTCSDGL